MIVRFLIPVLVALLLVVATVELGCVASEIHTTQTAEDLRPPDPVPSGLPTGVELDLRGPSRGGVVLTR